MAATIQAGSFSGHETFPLRFTWLPKAVREVAQDAEAFTQPDLAMVRLGVGKNMVRSMRHWALATGTLEEEPKSKRGRRLRASDFGEKLFGPDGWDPYLEDPATLWLLHWRITATPARATTWYWAFNHAPQPDFTKEEVAGWLTGLVEERGWTRTTVASLKRDIDCFFRCYVPSTATKKTAVEDVLDCPLVELPA